jgi:hypothetical protein
MAPRPGVPGEGVVAPVPGVVVLGGIPPGVAPVPVDGFVGGLVGAGAWGRAAVQKAVPTAKARTFRLRRYMLASCYNCGQ